MQVCLHLFNGCGTTPVAVTKPIVAVDYRTFPAVRMLAAFSSQILEVIARSSTASSRRVADLITTVGFQYPDHEHVLR